MIVKEFVGRVKSEITNLPQCGSIFEPILYRLELTNIETLSRERTQVSANS